MREIRIGYVSEEPHRPPAVGAAPYCRYLPVRDWNRLLARAGQLLNRAARRPWVQIDHLPERFRGQRLQTGVDLVHLHNQVGEGRHPWLTSFEWVLPHSQRASALPSNETLLQLAAQPTTARALAALAADPCRRLLALSRAAAERQRQLLAACPEERWQASVSPKISVLPPPQSPLLATVDAKPPLAGRPVHVLCLASSLPDEGAAQLLTAAAAMRSRHPRAFEVTLIGPLAAGKAGVADRARELVGLLERHRDWVTHHAALERRTLLSLMRSADLAVLTARSDAGFRQLLELQACGCPVISSDVGALGEYNDEACGWVIRLPREYSEPRELDAGRRERWARALGEGLMRCLREVLERPPLLRSRGEQALQRIEMAHDPALIGERLFDIYLDCLTLRPARAQRAPSVSS